MSASEWTEEKTFFFLKQLNFSDREIAVVKAIVDLKTNNEIAVMLFIEVGTVEKHTNHIYKKTNTKNRAALLKYLYTKGLHKIDTPPR